MSKPKLGPTGHYPRGPLNEYDEGEIKIAIGHTEDATVFMDFGTRIRWIAMGPEQARELAEMLSRSADRADGVEH